MFKDNQTFQPFSADDIPKAKGFYGQTLGLDVADEMDGLALKLASGANLFVYPKDDHEPASFTVLNFEVDDVDAAVDGLTAAGVTMEQYEGVTDDKGVHRGDQDPTIAWFKDPAGNVLSVIETA